MAEADWDQMAGDATAQSLRALVEEYTRAGLPVMNGSLKYSNFREGPEHVFTLNAYRLWEYVSLLNRLAERPGQLKFLDVGGAGAVLAYALAERGHQGVTVDLNPFLVAACNEVARQRKLPLEAKVCDATIDLPVTAEGFDLVTMVSVLEHIPEPEWTKVFTNIARTLRPGGWFYLTFDYGDYRTEHPFGQSIKDITPVVAELDAAGLRIKGNAPLELPAEWLGRRAAPKHEEYGREYLLHLGPVDGATPWTKLLKHQVKRLIVPFMKPQTRCAKHNFFRMLLEKK